ncbi:MAG: hypothetical protein WC755_09845 [Candidatus Woesearchaeota archaeon]
MKIRLGFVANSSSVSFTIYGVYFEDIERPIDIELLELKEGLNTFRCQEKGGYIGRELKDMKDDQTLGDFKKDTEKLIKETLNKDDLKFGIYEEGYYNG